LILRAINTSKRGHGRLRAQTCDGDRIDAAAAAVELGLLRWQLDHSHDPCRSSFCASGNVYDSTVPRQARASLNGAHNRQ